MAELAPSFCMPACCLYNARQPQTLRQNHLSLDFQPLGWRVDPGGGWFEWRFWRLSDEAFWV